MPLHPVIQAALKLAEGASPIETLPVNEVRRLLKLAYPPIVPPVEVSSAQDRTIPGPHGEIPVRIYTPHGDGPFPLLVFFHGSGFVTLDLDTHDDLCRRLCREAAYVVVSVDYRLSPEHKFPIPFDDCVAATLWATQSARSLNATDRIALSGDSAGACLAAATAANMRDRDGPKISGQLLFYPVTDYPDPMPESYTTCGQGYGLTRNGMLWFWNHYLRDTSDTRDPRCAPLRASDFRGLPPTYVVTAEYDVLRDEGEAYAQRLRDAGVAVQMERCAGLNHGFLKWVRQIDEVAALTERAVDWLKKIGRSS